MATKTRKKVGVTKKSKTTPEEMGSDISELTPKKRSLNKKLIFVGIGIVILAVALGIIARRYKSAFLVASVNGTPILRSELNGRLANRFGTQMLEALIGERLIKQAAQKQNIEISDAEVQAKIAEIEKSLTGGVSLDDSLKMQGMSKAEFTNQVKIQLIIDKIFAKDATVSTTEVDDFLKNNSVGLTSTIDAERRIQAESEIHNQKISQKFLEWFNKLKTDAKIQRYL